MLSWVQSARLSLGACAVVLVVSWVAVQIGKAAEGTSVAHSMQFDKLEANLATVSLLVLPFLFVVLRLGLLDRMRRLRIKLFVAFTVGQIVALIAAVIAAHNSRAMPFDAPNDGLFAVLLVYAAMLSLVLAYLLARSITQSVWLISAGAHQISGGDLDTVISVPTRDELAQLADALNAMAARLASAADQAQRVERARRDLIAAVSHDLRTPLAAMQATIEAIIDGVVTDDATIKRYLRTILSSTLDLSGLINDLFELSRIDAGALALSLAPTALRGLVASTLEPLHAQAAAHQITLINAVDTALPALQIDAQRMGRVLTNLIDNAFRYTPPGGSITVDASPQGEIVAITVTDTGPGIPPDDAPRIFEQFYRGEKSRSREHGGAGLGLAISKGIVDAHGGHLSVDLSYTGGAQFRIDIPLTPNRPALWADA